MLLYMSILIRELPFMDNGWWKSPTDENGKYTILSPEEMNKNRKDESIEEREQRWAQAAKRLRQSKPYQ